MSTGSEAKTSRQLAEKNVTRGAQIYLEISRNNIKQHAHCTVLKIHHWITELRYIKSHANNCEELAPFLIRLHDWNHNIC